MKYAGFKENIKLSKLGLGAMRLPQTEPGLAKPVDEPKARELIDYCMAHGVNYYDTAYIYHGGKSETILGRALSGYPRDSYYVADKFNVQANPDYQFQFQDQLDRLGMEYIDFYLLHGITDLTAADYESCGCISYFQEQKKQGKIRHFGFSFHGTPDCLPEDCMELLPKGNGSPAAWALRFVMDLPGIAVVLSGMSDMEQVKENIATADSEQALTGAELSQLSLISEKLRKKIAVPCTGCRYCCDNCPQGLDIPSLLSAYNDYRDEGAALGDKNMAVWRLHRLKALEKEKQPAACVGCGSCTAHCPQGLDIPTYMQEMSALLQ